MATFKLACRIGGNDAVHLDEHRSEARARGDRDHRQGRLGAYFGPEAGVAPVIGGPDEPSWVTHHRCAGRCAGPWSRAVTRCSLSVSTGTRRESTSTRAALGSTKGAAPGENPESKLSVL